MTLSEVQTKLETTGLPVAYHSFTEEEVKEKGIKLPFICWLNPRDNNFSADGVVYSTSHEITVELYEEYRDDNTERTVEAVLSDIYYTKSIEYIESEKMYEVIYEFEV